jgi:AraC-like DNA-binding protein
VIAPARFALFLPPFSVVQASLESCDVTSAGIAFIPPPASALPAEAVIVPDARESPATTQQDVLEQMQTSLSRIPIRRDVHAAGAARVAKAVLDEEYASRLTIAETAKRVGASPALLSRMFKAAYGMPPVQYRHHVRVMDALMRLSAGAAPADVFLDVGFEDLSRFYKVFRRLACGVPGAYRPARSRNAKT